MFFCITFFFKISVNEIKNLLFNEKKYLFAITIIIDPMPVFWQVQILKTFSRKQNIEIGVGNQEFDQTIKRINTTCVIPNACC